MTNLTKGSMAPLKLFTGIVVLLMCSLSAQAALLKYDITLFNYYGEGSGYILADTEQDAIVGGHLSKNNEFPGNFSITWSGVEPLILSSAIPPDYSAHTRSFDVVNDFTGEEGSLLLSFWLDDPDLTKPLAAQLNKQLATETISSLMFPSFLEVKETYGYSANGVFLRVGDPVGVPEPSHAALLFLGLLTMGFKRRASGGRRRQKRL